MVVHWLGYSFSPFCGRVVQPPLASRGSWLCHDTSAIVCTDAYRLRAGVRQILALGCPLAILADLIFVQLLHCFLYFSRRSNTFLIVRGTGIHLVVFCQVSSMQHILHCHRQQLCFEIDFVGPLSDDIFLDGDRWFP